MTDPYLTAQSDRMSDYPRRHAASHPDRVALYFGDEHITYADLDARVRQFSKALLASGVGPGDRVAMFAMARPEFVVSYLASISIGAIWQGLNLGYTGRELAYVLADSQPRLIFAAPPEFASATLDVLQEAVTEVDGVTPILSGSPEWEEFLAGAGGVSEETLDSAIEGVDALDAAMLVYTSGSTGAPKGALVRHAGLVRLGLVQSAKWDVPAPTVMCNLPINHIGCVGDLLGVPLIAGGSVVLRETFDAGQVLDDVQTYGIDALFQVATQLQRIAALDDFETRNLPTLRLVGWGGSALPQATMDRFRKKGCSLIATYGLTEATFSVTYSEIDASDEVLLNTVGTPDPHIQLRLLAEDGSWISNGSEGEVCIKHPATMAGYLNRPEETAAAYTPDGWLRTGDIGFLREDGNLVLVGRVSEMFKSGGYNVYPREIELIAEQLPDVEIAAVVPQPDPDFQEVGVAFIQPKAGHTLEIDEVREWLRSHLARYKVPKTIIIQESLPLLPIGKVDKQTLKATVLEGSQETS